MPRGGRRTDGEIVLVMDMGPLRTEVKSDVSMGMAAAWHEGAQHGAGQRNDGGPHDPCRHWHACADCRTHNPYFADAHRAHLEV